MASRAPALLAIVVLVVSRLAEAKDCSGTSTGLVPLTELGARLYLGQLAGGLYPGGANTPPPAHLAAGLAAAGAVLPRLASGVPDPGDGRVVLLSIGMSNTTMEFCRAGEGTTGCTAESFMGQAAAEPAVNRSTLVLVNGAKGGQVASAWTDPAHPNYDRIGGYLDALGLSEAQVQVVWAKLADPAPTSSLPNASADAYALEGHLGAAARALKSRYRNLRLLLLSSRIYAGYADIPLNPEPYAYESGFAVKWTVEAQIKQMAGDGVDAAAGDLDYSSVAPWIGWGPYLWADGTTPRTDGLTYACEDLASDGTHPASGAVRKVGELLLDFFLTSPLARGWFTTMTTATLCESIPVEGCQPAAARKARLSIREATAGARDALRWTWRGGSGARDEDFGTPTVGTAYGVCVYDAGGLKLAASAPAGGVCHGRPCWEQSSRGFRYSDHELTPDGLERVVLAASGAGEVRITVRGRGELLDLPELPLAPPLRVQLQQTDGDACWEAGYAALDQNDATRVRGRSD